MNDRARQMMGKTRNFLSGMLNKEFFVFLFFLALSSIFWLMMTLNEDYEKDIQVAMELANVPDNAVITTDIDSTVRVTVQDKGYTLAAYIYGRKQLRVKLNFATYADEDKGIGVIPSADLQKQIYKKLSSSSKITAIKPEKLEFHFNYGQSKTVPVRFNGHVETGQSYYLAATRFSPDRVTVYADNDMIDSIEYVSTTSMNVENLVDTLVREVQLEKQTGMKCVPASVTVTLCPDVLTEESFNIDIVAINVPEGITVRTFPSHVKVRFTVGAGMFRNVKAEQFEATVDYNDIVGNDTDQCSVTLSTVPPSVRDARLVTSVVGYIIEQ